MSCDDKQSFELEVTVPYMMSLLDISNLFMIFTGYLLSVRYIKKSKTFSFKELVI